MCIGRDNRGRVGAFTLLEITLAVAILGMMSLAIYKFVQSNMTAIRISTEVSAEDSLYAGLRDLLTSQWQSLAPGTGALMGDPYKLNDRSRDEVRWYCGSGPGLVTRYAPGDYNVVMRLRPPAMDSNRLDLGFSRKRRDETGIGASDDNWLPLIQDVQTLQVRYFDPRLNTWLDKWTDTVTLPRLVKITIGRRNATVPWEVVIPLSRTPL